MEVQVSLPFYGRNYTLPKAYITQYLPQSILADALQLDPEADTITLDNPIITPGVMTVIYTLARGVEPTRAEPDLVAADRYLNAPELLYYSDPLYERIPDRVNVNAPANQPIINEIIELDRAWLFAYLLARGLVPTIRMLVRAIRYGGPHIVALLLRDGRVDPNQMPGAPPNQELALSHAIYYGFMDAVRLLLADPRIDPSANDNQALTRAAHYNQPEILRLLLQDRRVDPAANDSRPMRMAANYRSPEALQVLLQDGRSDPNTRNGEVMRNALQRKDPGLVRLILADPRFQIISPNIIAELASRRDNLELIRVFLEDGRVDPTVHHNAALRIAQRNGHQDIVNLLLADPRVRAGLNAN